MQLLPFMKYTCMKAKSAVPGLEKRTQADTELVFRIKEGDRDALGQLITAYQRHILAVAFKMTGDWHIAQDIAQDVFITLMEKIDTFDPERNFFPWIYRVAINRSIDYLRRSGREKGFQEGWENTPRHETTSEDLMIKTEMRLRVRDVLSRLPVKYRTVLILRDIEGISCERIAEILEVVPATVRWRIFQARKLFRGAWDQEGESHGL
jgi:RNA polymerase sigma-70 factor (ECF subfamily)